MRVIRARYEKGVLRPLDRVDFKEGDVLVIFVRKRRVKEVLDKYEGMLGEADVKELGAFEEEAQT